MPKWQITQCYLSESNPSLYPPLSCSLISIFLMSNWIFFYMYIFIRPHSLLSLSSTNIHVLNLKRKENIKGFIISKRAKGNEEKRTSTSFGFFFLSFVICVHKFDEIKRKISDLCASTLVNAIFVGFSYILFSVWLLLTTVNRKKKLYPLCLN